MPTYAYPTATVQYDTDEIATLRDALFEEDIPQGYTRTVLVQLMLGGLAKEPGLMGSQGGSLGLPGPRPMVKRQSGTRATCPVNFEAGVTAQSFNGLDILNTSIADGPTESYRDFAKYTCYVGQAGDEAAENSGRGKRLDIWRSRQNQEIRQLARVMEADLWSTNTDTAKGSQNDFPGLRHLIATNPTTSVVVDGLNQSTFTPWRNAYNASVGSWASGGIDDLRTGVLAVSGSNGFEKPHLILTESTVAGYIYKSLEGIHRIVGSLDQRGADLAASKLPTFMGIPIAYTDDCPSGYVYGLNFDDMVSLVHANMDWRQLTPSEPNDQWLAKQIRWVLGAAPMMLKRRETHFVRAGITA